MTDDKTNGYEIFIDSSNTERLVVKLSKDNVILGSVQKKARDFRAENILETIDGLLVKSGINIDLITRVSFEKKGNSFTGLRIGAAISYILGFLLGGKVNNFNPDQAALIEYQPSKFD